MSLKGKIKVGDILSHPAWAGNTYQVLSIRSGELQLKNTDGTWDGWLSFSSLSTSVLINGMLATDYTDTKTPIERKIAFMRKRFEERKNENSQNW